MPELPEVETMRRGVLPIVGSQVLGVERAACGRKPIQITPRIDALARRTVGQTIVDVGRIGKRVVVQLSSSDALIFEPRMTGLVLLSDPPTQEHLRFRMRLSGSVDQLLYWDRRGLGSVRLLTAAEIATQLGGDRLGPDALLLDAELMRQRLSAGRRAIKVALLDQRAVAGIGNLYASEILHLAGVHPAKPCNVLRKADWQRIADATREVLSLAIRYEGSTLGDGTYRNALNQAGSYQNHHRVYDRADSVCGSCGRGAIVRVVQAQRATFFCPRCQRAPRKKPAH